MEHPAISIIIPVYNSGSYLMYQVESILAQTFKDFELLLVDDGSTDGVTSQLCDDLLEKDNRIKVFHKQNGGVSDARNYGIKHAKGEFIEFADHDDYMFPDNLQTMVEEIGHLDLLICNYAKGQRERIHTCKRNGKKVWEIVASSPEEMADVIPKIGYKNAPVWNQLFRRDIIEKHHIRFQKIQYEDELFSFSYLSHIDRLKRIDYQGYYWVYTENSQGSSHKYIAEMNWISQMEQIYEKMEKKYSLPQSFKSILNQRIAFRLSPLCLKGYHSDSYRNMKERLRVWNSVRRDPWLVNRIKLTQIRRIDAYVLLLAKLRLFYLLDPLFMMMICWRDKK